MGVMARDVVMMVVPLAICFLRQPSLYVERFPGGIEQAHGEQPLGRRLVAVRGEKPCGRIEFPQTRDDGEQHVFALASLQQIDLGQHDAVGDRHLLHRFHMLIERRHAVEGIDHRDDAFEPASGKKPRLAHHRMQHGCRIGESRGFDDDAVEALDLAAPAPRQKIVDRVDEIAADGAAQAARRHLDDILVGAFDQQMIDADIAELVDDHGGIAEKRILQQEVQ